MLTKLCAIKLAPALRQAHLGRRLYIVPSFLAPPKRSSLVRNRYCSHSRTDFLPNSVRGLLAVRNMGSSLYNSDTPADVSEAKALHLLTQSTPNGQKVQIMLEELALTYGTTWTTTLMDISTNEQKKEWYLRLNPNGRIPTIIDNSSTRPFPIMETSAELLYLADKYDSNGLFVFQTSLREHSQMLQWLFFWHGSGAPNQAQLGYFSRAQEQMPLAIERFRNETLRVFGVLELHLSGKLADAPRKFLAGESPGKYSLADIGTWTWVSKWKMSGLTETDMEAFPHLKGWIVRIAERPAVQTATGDKYAKK